jgi:hypothetical protein
MNLVEFFSTQHDMFRVILPPSESALESICLRLTSKAMAAAVDAAGYEPGKSIVTYRIMDDTQTRVLVRHHASWTENDACIYHFFTYGLTHPHFLMYGFWCEPTYPSMGGGFRVFQPTFYRLLDNWTQYCNRVSVTLRLPSRISRLLGYAIKGALDHGARWFIAWVLSEPRFLNIEENPVFNASEWFFHGFHWLAIEYALRWDDPFLIERYWNFITQNDIGTAVQELAEKHAKPNVLQWLKDELRRGTKRKADEVEGLVDEGSARKVARLEE